MAKSSFLKLFMWLFFWNTAKKKTKRWNLKQLLPAFHKGSSPGIPGPTEDGCTLNAEISMEGRGASCRPHEARRTAGLPSSLLQDHRQRWHLVCASRGAAAEAEGADQGWATFVAGTEQSLWLGIVSRSNRSIPSGGSAPLCPHFGRILLLSSLYQLILSLFSSICFTWRMTFNRFLWGP